MTEMTQKSLLLHAPNVHTGGGLVLLRELLASQRVTLRFAQCDVRALRYLPAQPGQYIVKPSILSRLVAEWRLARRSRAGDTILCFHNIPPLFRCRGKVAVYVQNRLLLESALQGFGLRTRLRLMIERAWLRCCKHHASQYYVQTPSMKIALQHALGRNTAIDIRPFVPVFAVKPMLPKRYDFVYVSSGEAHKNHGALLDAWQLLAAAGKFPSLALTIDDAQYPVLAARIAKAQEGGLAITNLMNTPAIEIYPLAGALIYPSLSESFGLPLIEASRQGLPILATNLAYVDDVADPVARFDARSPTSIRDAVLAYLETPTPAAPARAWPTASEFLAAI